MIKINVKCSNSQQTSELSLCSKDFKICIEMNKTKTDRSDKVKKPLQTWILAINQNTFAYKE